MSSASYVCSVCVPQHLICTDGGISKHSYFAFHSTDTKYTRQRDENDSKRCVGHLLHQQYCTIYMCFEENVLKCLLGRKRIVNTTEHGDGFSNIVQVEV